MTSAGETATPRGRARGGATLTGRRPGPGEQRTDGAATAQDLLRNVLDITSRLVEAPDRAVVTSTLVERGIPAFGADAGSVHLLDEDGETLVLAASTGWPDRETERFATFRIDDDLPAAVAVRTLTTITFSSHSDLEHHYPALAAVQEVIGDEAWVIVPIAIGGRAIGVLGLSSFTRGTFGEQERASLEALAATAGLAIERATNHEAIAGIANELQQALLPTTIARHPSYDAAARHRPCPGIAQVGGDWYEVVPGPDDALFAIGDVAGHGAPAARMMAAARYGLSALARHERRPSELLRQLDCYLQGLGEDGFMTCCVVRYEFGTRTMSYASAGHPPPLLAHAGGVSFVDVTPGPPFGASSGERPPEVETAVGVGTTTVLYTDGLIERRGQHLDEGLARLRDALPGVAALRSTDELVGSLVRRLGTDATDDVAVLGVRFL